MFSDDFLHFLKIKIFFLSNSPKLSCGFKFHFPRFSSVTELPVSCPDFSAMVYTDQNSANHYYIVPEFGPGNVTLLESIMRYMYFYSIVIILAFSCFRRIWEFRNVFKFHAYAVTKILFLTTAKACWSLPDLPTTNACKSNDFKQYKS